MKRLATVALVAIAGLAGCAENGPESTLAPASPDFHHATAGVARVTSANPTGPGSFHWAIDRANRTPAIGRIVFAERLRPIALTRRIEFLGTQDLVIEGRGVVLTGELLDGGSTALRFAGGGEVTIRQLTVRNAPAEGITVDIPAGSIGTKKVTLHAVTVAGNQGHGVLVNDQVDPDDTANPNGSDASVEVVVVDSRFQTNGFGTLDRDGLRVNEGGLGDLRFTLIGGVADGNGADGIELDERGSGDVHLDVSNSTIVNNGSFDVTLADLDDGFDVDESGDGGVFAKVTNTVASDNKEEGLDFNENDAGDMRVELVSVEASRNLEEGIDLEEDDDFQGGGDLIVTAVDVTANGNGPGGDGGLKIRERGDGNIDADIRGAVTSGNLTGGTSIREQGNGDLIARIDGLTANQNGASGIAFREDDAGSQAAAVKNATAEANGVHGIDFDENSAGDLSATVEASRAVGNTGAGVRADQQTAGVGSLSLTGVTSSGNGGGDLVTNAGVTVTQLP
ncbi:MAG: hypothetical protein ACKVZ0_10640 [Gemmatimonadales bacterium]